MRLIKTIFLTLAAAVTFGSSVLNAAFDSFNSLDTSSRWEVVGGTWGVNNGILTGFWDTSAAFTDQGNLLIRGQDTSQNFDAWFSAVLTNGAQGFSLYSGAGALYKVNVGSTVVSVARRTTTAAVNYTTVASASLSGVSGSADSLVQISRRGAVFRIYVNGAYALEFTDTVWNGALRVGLSAYGTTTYDTFEYRAAPDAVSTSVAPTVTAQPQSQSVTVGASVTFTAAASGSPTPSYQWIKDGMNINGATSATYTISSVAASDAGTYAVIVSNSAGVVTSTAATLSVTTPSSPGSANGSSRIYALSVRSFAGSDNNTLIMGVVLSGSAAKSLVARGIGPSLVQNGISGFLVDPQLKLFNGSGTLIQSNDDWGGGAVLANAFAAVGLAPLSPTSKDAAMLLAANPGVYTAQLTSVAGSGIALMELYDAGSATDSTRMTALSVRGAVGSGPNVLIVGFVIAGSGTKQVVIRGVGPGLIASGVSGVLTDPQLQLFNSSGGQIQSNDDWGGGTTLANAFKSVGLAALPASSKDAAMIASLPAGVYTVQLSGVNGTTGVGLIEFYELP